MKRLSLGSLLLSLLVLTWGVISPGAANADDGPAVATVRLTIAAPAGVPASVALLGRAGPADKSNYVAAKALSGTSTVVALKVKAGSYRVLAQSITVDGKFYVPTTNRDQVLVTTGSPTDLKVSYALDDSVSDFRATDIKPTSITLAWTAQPQFTVTVRRTSGAAPATSPGEGTNVPVKAGTATDSGLVPGSQYTYALFAEYRGKLVGPLVLRVGTVSPDPTQATYVANPQTLIAKAADVVTATPTGSGVQVVLAAGLPIPLIGAAVVLPISVSLPGGFLGVVTAIAPDGRTLSLVAGGLSDAFDYYDISVPDIQGGDPLPLTAAQQAPNALNKTAAPDPSNGPVAPADRKPLDAALSATPKAAAPSAGSAKAAAGPAAGKLLTCTTSKNGPEISFSPSLSLAGHFNATISKYKFLGQTIPTGASLDMSVAATISGAATIETSASLTCNAPFVPVLVPITQAPVPISFFFSPTAQFAVNGAVKISNLGVAVTAGVKVSGHLGLTDGASFTGSPIFSAVPLTPSVVANGSVTLKVGGQIIVGPGAGTVKAGVIAGVGGELNPIDAKFSAVFPIGDPRFNACLQASAVFTRSLSLTAKAWLGKWDITKSITVDALKGSSNYPGSPWSLPAGCKDTATPSDNVLGDGVTKVGDSVTGNPNQWGYLPGFVPGKKSWVLSTGNIANAVGAPSSFASTSLGGAGDADLSALSGRPTFDAVAYNVTLVPTGSTLHVRYVFASEEYPEYVGSQFNDAMAVYVNGKNCALVPGTNDAVSVNTINAGKNSTFFVDNLTGASGYGTTMDGLTKPLECKVPVQIGKPVTVKITVADASDAIYDSAVALLDQGIWSD